MHEARLADRHVHQAGCRIDEGHVRRAGDRPLVGDRPGIAVQLHDGGIVACGVEPAAVALAWVLRQPGMIAIPKAVKPEHVRANMQALEVKLNAMNDTFDAAFDPNDYINSATRMYLVN